MNHEETQFKRQCFYVWSAVKEDGSVACSVGAGSADDEFDRAANAHCTTGAVIDFELHFDLADVLGSIVEGHELADGCIDAKAEPTVRAIKTELEAMLAKIATLRFREVV
jgi:hypothetical protein